MRRLISRLVPRVATRRLCDCAIGAPKRPLGLQNVTHTPNRNLRIAPALRITPKVVEVAPDGTLLPGCPRFAILNTLVPSARRLSLTFPGIRNAREMARSTGRWPGA